MSRGKRQPLTDTTMTAREANAILAESEADDEDVRLMAAEVTAHLDCLDDATGEQKHYTPELLQRYCDAATSPGTFTRLALESDEPPETRLEGIVTSLGLHKAKKRAAERGADPDEVVARYRERMMQLISTRPDYN
jgi:hypothetical protein